MTNEPTPVLLDSPSVIVFPPLLPSGTFLLSVLLNWIWPWHFPSAPWMKVVGGVVVVCGFGLMARGQQTMVRAGTNVPPNKPALVIVSDGPFRFTRNPLYLGGTFVYVGLTLIFNLVWAVILFVPMMLVLHWGIVGREERYLERKFGAAYTDYKARVPRWLLRS